MKYEMDLETFLFGNVGQRGSPPLWGGWYSVQGDCHMDSKVAMASYENFTYAVIQIIQNQGWDTVKRVPVKLEGNLKITSSLQIFELPNRRQLREWYLRETAKYIEYEEIGEEKKLKSPPKRYWSETLQKHVTVPDDDGNSPSSSPKMNHDAHISSWCRGAEWAWSDIENYPRPWGCDLAWRDWALPRVMKVLKSARKAGLSLKINGMVRSESYSGYDLLMALEDLYWMETL